MKRGSVTTGCIVTEITLGLPRLLLAQSLSLFLFRVCPCVFALVVCHFGFIHNTNTSTLALSLSLSSVPGGTSAGCDYTE